MLRYFHIPFLYFLCIAILSVMASCNPSPKNEISVTDPAYRPCVVRLDSTLYSGVVAPLSPSEVAGLRRYAHVTLMNEEAYFTTEYAQRIASSNAVKIFGPDVKKKLPDLTEFTNDYARAHSRARRILPDLFLPDSIFMMISPFRQQVFMVDTVAFVVSNHFLGSTYPGYENFSESERLRREPSRMAPAIAEAMIRSTYPAEPTSVLAAMAYEGAVYYMIHQLFPSLPDSVLLGMPDKTIRSLRRQGQTVIHRLAASDMLFSSDITLGSRMIDSPAPIIVADGTLPPHTGRYLGYRLVTALAKQQSDDSSDMSFYLSDAFCNSPSLLQQASDAFITK